MKLQAVRNNFSRHVSFVFIGIGGIRHACLTYVLWYLFCAAIKHLLMSRFLSSLSSWFASFALLLFHVRGTLLLTLNILQSVILQGNIIKVVQIWIPMRHSFLKERQLRNIFRFLGNEAGFPQNTKTSPMTFLRRTGSKLQTTKFLWQRQSVNLTEISSGRKVACFRWNLTLLRSVYLRAHFSQLYF